MTAERLTPSTPGAAGPAPTVAAPTAAAPRPLTDEAVAADHADHASRHPDRLVATLLRTKSVAGRAVLALLAGGEGTTPAQLEDLGRRIDAGELPADAPEATGALPDPDPALLTQYARVVALQLATPEDVSAALGLFSLAHTLSDGRHPAKAAADLWSQLLVVRQAPGDAERARTVIDRGAGTPEPSELSAIDLLNPWRTADGSGVGARPEPAAHERWWQEFSGRLGAGLGATVRLGDVDDLFDRAWLAGHGLDADSLLRTPFDRLVGEGGTPVDHPFRVTVIMSAFNPGPEVLLAARSMVSQTWQNWELLVVDDASPAPTPGVLEAIEDLDPRIHVVRKAVNGGTYRCRNTAIRRATGDAIVVLDSDDWAHPELLEAGVRPLLTPDDPSLAPAIATRQRALRIGDDLRITRPGYPGAISCAPSLMVPMVGGVSRIGFFDPVRKAADTEYARRLEAATGAEVLQTEHVLVLMRTDAGSLSAADFTRGWRHSSRHEYKNAYASWHAAIKQGDDPWLDPDGPPRIAGPHRWSSAVKVPEAARPHVEVVVAGDWRRYGGPQRSMMEEIHSLLEAGHSVGVMHLEALRFMRTTDDPLCAPVQELLDAGRVRLVHLDDAVDVDLLLLRYPPILQYPPHAPVDKHGQPSAVRPRHLVIVANQAPAERDGTDQRYTVPTVEAHARELFGTEPLWAPQGPSIRTILREHTTALTDWDDPGLVDTATWPTRDPDAPLPTVPVVGRYSRDDRIKFPTTWETLAAAYDLGPGVHVRMMGAPRTVKRLRAEATAAGRPAPQPAWELLPHGAMPVEEFLAGTDVFVYVDNPDAHEAFGRTLLEAAASGVPVVTIPKHRETFGDLLLYAEPDEVPAVVQRLLADPVAYRERVEHQLRVVAERYSRASFTQHVEGLVGPPTPEGPDVAAGAEAADRPAPDAPTTGDPAPDVPAVPVVVTVAPTGDPRLPLEVAVDGPAHPDPRLVARTMPLRRPADGERADALAAVGSPEAVQAALGAHAAATASGAGEQAALEAAQRVPGTRAVVLLRDGEVAALVPRGTTTEVDGRTVALQLPTGPLASGLVWRALAPSPQRVSVLAPPQEAA
ncbi:glycosyltransferase [Kytococcus schroeteri]|uniref:glycosyltransferase n=2 Tax=Kytococcus TaxID=57499 RepID=UPI0035E666FA